MYIGNDLQVAESGNKIIDDISSGFNGSTTSFALLVGGAAPVPFPINTQQIYISVNGVIQEPDPTGSAGFKLLGNNIVFSSAPANGHAFFGVILSGADYVTVGTEFPAGSATAPSITFGNDNNTGLYSVTGGTMGFTSDGVLTFSLSGDGFNLPDNKKLQIGTGNDLELYHNSTNTYLENDTGTFFIRGDDLKLTSVVGETYLAGAANGSCDLYHNNVLKAHTNAAGFNIIGVCVDDGATHDGDVTFTGASASVTWDKSVDDLIFADNAKAAFGTSSDLTIYHDGSHSYIADTGTGRLHINTSELRVNNAADNEILISATENGAVELYYDNSKKIETTSSGVKFTGTTSHLNWLQGSNDDKLRFNDGVKATFGNSDDLQIYHDGTNSHLNNSTGYLIVGTDSYAVKDQTLNEFYIKALKDGAVELYYDNSKKLETTASGVSILGNAVLDDGTNARITLQAEDTNTNQILSTTTNFGSYCEIKYRGTDHIFQYGTTELLRIASGGDVGIGNNSPSCKLAITDLAEHTAYASATPSVTDCMLQLYNNPPNETANDHATIQFGVNGGSHNRVASISAVAESAGNRKLALTFCTDEAGSRTEKLRITGDGNVGIGGSPTNNLHLGASGADQIRSMKIDGTNGSSELQGFIIENDGANSRVNLKLGTGGGTPATKLTLLPAGGMTFNGDTAAANALDDYEEGTFTPAVTSGLSGGTIAYNSRSGRYTKIGNVVNFTFHMNISSCSLDSGQLKFGGLPITSVNNDSNKTGAAFMIISNGNIGSTNTFRVETNSTDLSVITGAGDAYAANSSSLDNGNRQIAFAGFYYAA